MTTPPFIASLGFSIRYTATIIVIVEIFAFSNPTPPLRIVAMQRCSGLTDTREVIPTRSIAGRGSPYHPRPAAA